MSLYNFTLDSDPIGEEELNILSQKSNHSQFHAEEDADFENEDESQEIYSSDKFSSQEFSQDKSKSEDDYFGQDAIEDPKIICSLSLLLKLFNTCRESNCGSACDPDNTKWTYSGAMITISTCCNNNHTTKWSSSPMVGSGKSKVATINTLLGTYSYLSGVNVKKMLEFFGRLRIVCVSKSFLYRLQTKILYRVIWAFWQYMQDIEVCEVKKSIAETGRTLDVAGDGKFDSRGFSAFYCSYFVVDVMTKKVLGLWVATKEMAASSGMMEPLAAKEVILDLAHGHELQIDTVTTDRSSTMKTMLSELDSDLPEGYCNPEHLYDMWHLIKGVNKDIWKASKLKSCLVLSAWQPSITNQMWHAFSSSIGNEVLLREKLLSITDHMCNKHEFVNNVEYKKCPHGGVEGDRETRPWLDQDSLAITKVKAAIKGYKNGRLDDLAMMTKFTHTGVVENIFSMQGKYATKEVFFSHHSMLCKNALTAIDHNMNSDRPQGKTKSGALQFDLVTNRNGKKYYVKPRPALKDISWKDSIASSTLQAFAERALPDSSLPLGCELKTRKKTAEKPEKTAAIANHQSRMKRSVCEDS